jgi:hypothetical protein
VYRSAVACFERCLDADPADESLKADARHNLELAKLLWAEANRRAARKETPNVPPPEEQPPPESLPPPRTGGTDPDLNHQEPGAENPGMSPRPIQQMNPAQTPTGKPHETARQAPGSGTLPVLKDEARPQPMSPEDTRKHLDEIRTRLRDDQRKMRELLYPADRPGLRDW